MWDTSLPRTSNLAISVFQVHRRYRKNLLIHTPIDKDKYRLSCCVEKISKIFSWENNVISFAQVQPKAAAQKISHCFLKKIFSIIFQHSKITYLSIYPLFIIKPIFFIDLVDRFLVNSSLKLCFWSKKLKVLFFFFFLQQEIHSIRPTDWAESRTNQAPMKV